MAKPHTSMKRPFVASPDQVLIRRHPDGETAIIEYAEDDAMGVNLKIGRELPHLSDQEVLDRHNAVLEAMEDMRRDYEHVAIEIPMGRPQVEYFERGGQWVPRGDVVRVLVTDDMDSDGDPAFVVDDIELTLGEFGRMLHTWNGWGLRVTVVPEDDLYEQPRVEVRDPDDTDG